MPADPNSTVLLLHIHREASVSKAGRVRLRLRGEARHAREFSTIYVRK